MPTTIVAPNVLLGKNGDPFPNSRVGVDRHHRCTLAPQEVRDLHLGLQAKGYDLLNTKLQLTRLPGKPTKNTPPITFERSGRQPAFRPRWKAGTLAHQPN